MVGGGLRIGGILKDSEKNGTLKNLETTLQQDVTRYRKLKQAIQCDNSTNWVILRNSKIVKSGSSMGTLLESIDTILPNLYCIQYNSQEADDLLKNLVTVACGITEEAMNTPAGRIALEQIEREGVRDEQTKRQAFESARRAVAQRLRRNNRSGLLTGLVQLMLHDLWQAQWPTIWPWQLQELQQEKLSKRWRKLPAV